MQFRRLSHESYTVAWICALPSEMAVAKAMLDFPHPSLPQDRNDQNTYALGEIDGRNVVIACLPAGRYGTNSAAVVATQLLRTFTSVRFGLMVGIGGGVPGGSKDIRLGDIVVSRPEKTSGGVVQYDYGKILSGGDFERTGDLNKPPQVLLTAVTALESECYMGRNRIEHFLSEMIRKHPSMATEFTHPGQEDLLFESTYEHVNLNPNYNDCNECERSRLVARPPRYASSPRIHCGLIASSSQVMKDAEKRDRLSAQLGVSCFEMEAAGLMDNFPSIVIRGIADYADSHKNKHWQSYAAATAASYAKWLILTTPVIEILKTPTVLQVTSYPKNIYPHSPPISPEFRPIRPQITNPSSVNIYAEPKSHVSSHRPDQPSSTAPPLAKALDQYFIPKRSSYSDEDLGKIEILLRTSKSEYFKTPRLYTIVRCAGLPERYLDYFIRRKLSDQSLPFAQSSQLPSKFSEGQKARLIEAQDLVCGNSDVIQMMAKGVHMTFTQTPEYFVSHEIIAKGEKSLVDKVLCVLGVEYYARKQFHRRVMSSEDVQALQSFKQEMDIMKKIDHHHCVKLIASYTDRNVFAFIMLPVAQYNLATYLEMVTGSGLDGKSNILLSFIGCLSRTIWFIHRQKLRHRDIKPENILVHDNRVVVTDFDCSHDWSHTNRSTTVKAPPLTWKYASPEVARAGMQETNRINSSSDIWSLGCVFLEIITVLKRCSLIDLANFLHGQYYSNRQEEVRLWIDHLKSREPKGSADVVLDWVKEMLQEDPDLRPKAHELVERIRFDPYLCCEECARYDRTKVEDEEPKVSVEYNKVTTTIESLNITDSNGEKGVTAASLQQTSSSFAAELPGMARETSRTDSTNNTSFVTTDDCGWSYSNPSTCETSASLLFPGTSSPPSLKPVEPIESGSKTFSKNKFLADVSTEMGVPEGQLKSSHRFAIHSAYTVYKKDMLAAGFAEVN